MAKTATHLLFESASGYAIFKVKDYEEIGSRSKEVQQSIQDLHKFGKMVELQSFAPFKNAADALGNANDVSEGILNESLQSLLELNLAKSKNSPICLGLSEPGLASSIKSGAGIECVCDPQDRSWELIRGIRLHAGKLLKGLQTDDILKAQLGLGHSYSRAKLKFNVNRTDNMIIQAIALLDQLDKDVNLFAMRIREWYGYHFPELIKFVPDNYEYAKTAKFIGDKATLDESKLDELETLLGDDRTRAQNILDAARGSMGSSLSEVDLINISAFASRVISLAEYRVSLTTYLSTKMNMVAPSLAALLGDRISARLISHAGSLTNLSKYPASTIQILGAEKALFRALKTKGNTPKYGLLYHSSFIGRAGPKHKGRISRFLANKCAIAARIDCFTDKPTTKFGDALRAQVEERLNFFDTGTAPSKNSEAMQKVLEALRLEDDDEDEEDEEMPEAGPLTTLEMTPTKSKKDKKKKDKKRKSDAMEVDGMDTEEEDQPSKKVKLSKEEKKALRKEKKKQAKEAARQDENLEGEGEKGEKSVKERKKKKDKSEKKKKVKESS